MLVDHLGYFFFPDLFWLRIIGRLAFPLFAWLIANGAYHTKNIHAYLLRLFMFALISQVPFLYANRLIDPTYNSLNVFFTLSIGLSAIVLMKQIKSKAMWILIVVLSAVFAQLLQTDYGGFGVLLIVSSFIFFKQWNYLIISQTLILVAESLSMLLAHNVLGLVEFFGVFSLLIIYFYNQREGRKTKQLFYAIYPVQYIVILLLQYFLK